MTPSSTFVHTVNGLKLPQSGDVDRLVSLSLFSYLVTLRLLVIRYEVM